MNRRGFTLIELMLVMALMLIVLGVTFPTLKAFFRGRGLDSEARRFLSLIHYGQSRAISEGMPVILWIDARRGTYGLRLQPGYTTEADSFVREYAVADDMQISASAPLLLDRTSPQVVQATRSIGNLPAIRFLPDGFISEISPARVLIQQPPDSAIGIIQSTNRLRYEIESIPSLPARR